MKSKNEPTNDPAQKYTEFAGQLTFDRLPIGLVEVLKRMVLDTLGTTLAGGTLGSGCPELVEVARAMGGTAESSLIGYGDRLPATIAALVNGAMSHALNYDD